MDPNKLYVANILGETTLEALRHLSACGGVLQTHV
jgi:hypothetical protein